MDMIVLQTAIKKIRGKESTVLVIKGIDTGRGKNL